MYSGGMPWLTPGTPSGNTALRSPGSFFLSLRPKMSSLSGSKSAQPARTGITPTMTANNRMRCMRRINKSSALATVGADQSRQHVDARAGARRRLGIGRDHIDIAARGGDIVIFPGRQRQQLARGMAEGAARLSQRIQAVAQIGKLGAIDQQQAGPNASEILPGRPQRTIGGDGVIGFHRVGRLDRRQFGGAAEARQYAVAARRLAYDLGERGLRLGMLALFAQRHRGFERGAGGGGLLGDIIFVAAPGGDAGDNQHGDGND